MSAIVRLFSADVGLTIITNNSASYFFISIV